MTNLSSTGCSVAAKSCARFKDMCNVFNRNKFSYFQSQTLFFAHANNQILCIRDRWLHKLSMEFWTPHSQLYADTFLLSLTDKMVILTYSSLKSSELLSVVSLPCPNPWSGFNRQILVTKVLSIYSKPLYKIHPAGKCCHLSLCKTQGKIWMWTSR